MLLPPSLLSPTALTVNDKFETLAVELCADVDDLCNITARHARLATRP
jgi:hypothetical protein